LEHVHLCDLCPTRGALIGSIPVLNSLIFIANISGEKVEIDQEARKALNFIETGNK